MNYIFAAVQYSYDASLVKIFAQKNLLGDIVMCSKDRTVEVYFLLNVVVDGTGR